MTVAGLPAAPRSVESDPLRDSRCPAARAARDQADWLSWLELGGMAPRTLADYQWVVDFLLRAFPKKTIREFTDGDVAFVLRQFPAQSRRVRAAAFKSFFRWARQTRRIDGNPMDLLPQLKREPQAPVTVFSLAEIGLLESLPSPDGHLMAVLFGTGVRKAEARHLRARSFDLGRGRLNLVDGTKGAKPRVVPLSTHVQRAVTDLCTLEGIGPDAYLWGHKPGGGRVQRHRPIGEGTFHRWWASCIEATDVPYRKPHTTRHTYATRWRKRGLAIDDIQLLLGHASISTTKDIYVHSEVEDVADRMALLLEADDD